MAIYLLFREVANSEIGGGFLPKMFVYNSQNPHKISQDFDNKVAVSQLFKFRRLISAVSQSAGLLSEKLRVQTPAGPTLDRVLDVANLSSAGWVISFRSRNGYL